MNLLYEDMDGQNNMNTYTKQIDDPTISFEEYINGFNPEPNCNHNPDPNPNPDPNTMGNDDESGRVTELGSSEHHGPSDPCEISTSYSVGIAKSGIVKDKDIDEHDIIMNTIADSGADIDVISGTMKDTYSNITKLVNTTLNGIGGASRVHESADYEHLEGLHTRQGIVRRNLRGRL